MLSIRVASAHALAGASQSRQRWRMAGGAVVLPTPPPALIVLSELLDKLLRERVRSGVCDDVNVLRHVSPRLGFSCIVFGL
jgi:hypothetical protein